MAHPNNRTQRQHDDPASVPPEADSEAGGEPIATRTVAGKPEATHGDDDRLTAEEVMEPSAAPEPVKSSPRYSYLSIAAAVVLVLLVIALIL